MSLNELFTTFESSLVLFGKNRETKEYRKLLLFECFVLSLKGGTLEAIKLFKECSSLKKQYSGDDVYTFLSLLDAHTGDWDKLFVSHVGFNRTVAVIKEWDIYIKTGTLSCGTEVFQSSALSFVD